MGITAPAMGFVITTQNMSVPRKVANTIARAGSLFEVFWGQLFWRSVQSELNLETVSLLA